VFLFGQGVNHQQFRMLIKRNLNKNDRFYLILLYFSNENTELIFCYAVSRRRAAQPRADKRLGGVPRKGCDFPMSPVLGEQRRVVCFMQTK
jgi:hypothetical protein